MNLLKRVIAAVRFHQIPRQSAAITFYALLSLAPILVLFVSLASEILQQTEIELQIVSFIETTLGLSQKGVALIQTVLENAQQLRWSWETGFAVMVLFISSSFVFLELQRVLNQIFHSTALTEASQWSFLLERARSFGLVFVTGVLAVVAFLVGPILSLIQAHTERISFSGALVAVWDWLGSWMVLSIFFTLIFKIIPKKAPSILNCFYGGLFSAFLFVLGKWLMGKYLVLNATTSLYGATGSLVFLLLWIYYSCQIVLLGAIFTASLEKTKQPRRSKVGARTSKKR